MGQDGAPPRTHRRIPHRAWKEPGVRASPSASSESPGHSLDPGISRSFPGRSAARPRLRLHQGGGREGLWRNTSVVASGREPEPSGSVSRAGVGKEPIIPAVRFGPRTGTGGQRRLPSVPGASWSCPGRGFRDEGMVWPGANSDICGVWVDVFAESQRRAKLQHPGLTEESGRG